MIVNVYNEDEAHKWNEIKLYVGGHLVSSLLSLSNFYYKGTYYNHSQNFKPKQERGYEPFEQENPPPFLFHYCTFFDISSYSTISLIGFYWNSRIFRNVCHT